MKKFICRMLIVLLCTSYSTGAKAIIPPFDFTPLIPLAPQICAMCTPSAITEVVTVAQQVYGMREKLQEFTNISKIKQALVAYATELGRSAFAQLKQRLGRKLISFSRTLDENTKVDLTKEDEVKAVFIERFLQYPSKKSDVKSVYREQGQQLLIDTTLEMFITAKAMENELQAKLDELDKIEQCVVGGKSEECSKVGMEQYNCSSGNVDEDEMCYWRNDMVVAQIYDFIMRYTETLLAMDAQYQAVQAIGSRPEILEYVEPKKDDKSSALDFPKEVDVAQSTLSWNMGFAQMEAGSLMEEEWDAADADPGEPVVTDEGFEIVQGVGGYESALSGKKDDFMSLSVIEKARANVNNAMKAHNLKQSLDGYRKTFQSYHDMEKYHKRIVDNLKISEECIHNYLAEYYNNATAAWAGEGCGMYRDDAMYCHGSGQGNFDIPCPDDENETCYVMDITDTTGRSGISGYLLKTYQEAKNKLAQNEVDAYVDDNSSEDDLMSLLGETTQKSDENSDKYISTIDTSDPKDSKSSIISSDEMDRQGRAKEKEYNDGEKETYLRHPALEEEMEAETRANGLLNWTLGAEVAKEMIRTSYPTSEVNFGTMKNPFPLWVDQREFYDQYIDGKYANIRDYLENEQFGDMLVELALTANEQMEYEIDPLNPTVKEDEHEAIEDFADALKKTTEDNEISTMLAAEATALNNLRSQHEKDIKEQKAIIARAYEAMEKDAEELDGLQKSYNEKKDTVRDAEQTSPHAQTALTESENMYADRPDDERPDEDDSPQNVNVKNTRDDKQNASLAAQTELETMIFRINTLQNNLRKNQKIVDDAKSKLIELGKLYVQAYDNVVWENKQAIDEAAGNRRQSDMYKMATDAIGDVGAMGVANQLIQCVRQYALQQADEAVEKIKDMQQSDEIYYTHNYDKLADIHKTFIKKLTEFDPEEVLTPEKCGIEEDLFAKILTPELTQKLAELFVPMCENDYCTTAEDVHFVGLYSQKRDFRLPTPPVDLASAPLREIFHFDAVDYDLIEKYATKDEGVYNNHDVTITADSFLHSGLDLPEIWKYILKHRAYVEKDFDFKRLFSRGNTEENGAEDIGAISYLRSGIYPCQLDGHIVDADYVEDDSRYDLTYRFVSSLGNVIAQKCRNVGLERTPHGLTVLDLETDFAQIHEGSDHPAMAQSSELGQILAYVEDVKTIRMLGRDIQVPSGRYKLTFNAALQSVMQSIEDYNNEDDDPEIEEQYRYANRTLFDRNQFGDYLNNVEAEAKATEIMDNLKLKIKEVQDKFLEICAEFDISVREDFDMGQESDYQMALEALKNIKEQAIRGAQTELQNINMGKIQSEYVKKDKENIEHAIEVMHTDDNEVVNISGSEEIAELKDKIAEHQADRDVNDAYEKKRQEDMDKKIRQYPYPYCPVYLR